MMTQFDKSGPETELGEVAYGCIREQMLTGQLKAGDKISESSLAEKFNISRTPVRDAIRRLQVEGLVYRIPRSGTYVARPSRNRLVETYGIRIAIESFAAKEAALLVKLDDVRELKELCQKMRKAARAFCDSGSQVMGGPNLEAFLVADLGFHVLILKIANNLRAAKLVMDSRIDSMMFGSQTHERTLSHVAGVLYYHHRVYRALQRRNGDEARHWMESHIRESMEVALSRHDKEEFEARVPQGQGGDLDKTIETVLRSMRHKI